jgi:hypothetical protein
MSTSRATRDLSGSPRRRSAAVTTAAHVREDDERRLDGSDGALDRNELVAKFIFQDDLNPARHRRD